jgi:hypothetical protein
VAGHTDVRWAVLDALTAPAVERRPRLSGDSSGRVFQYLGNVERPAAIGFVGERGRLVYDLRDATIETGTSRVPVHAADEGTQAAWRELVHFWERLVLAGAAGRGEAAGEAVEPR